MYQPYTQNITLSMSSSYLDSTENESETFCCDKTVATYTTRNVPNAPSLMYPFLISIRDLTKPSSSRACSSRFIFFKDWAMWSWCGFSCVFLCSDRKIFVINPPLPVFLLISGCRFCIISALDSKQQRRSNYLIKCQRAFSRALTFKHSRFLYHYL